MPDQRDYEIARLINEGHQHFAQHRRTNDGGYLTRAYDAWRRADAIAPADWVGRSVLDYNIGTALRLLADLAPSARMYGQAIQKLEAACRIGFPSREHLLLAARELAAARLARYYLSEELHDLSAAISALRAAASQAPPTEQVELRANAGRLLLLLHEKTDDDADLSAALESLIVARSLDRQVFNDLAGARTTLWRGILRAVRAGLLGNRLDQFAEIGNDEVQDPGISVEQRGNWMNTLAECLFRRARERGSPADEERALQLTGERLELLRDDPNIARMLPAIRRLAPPQRAEFYRLLLLHPGTAARDAAIAQRPELHAALYADVDDGLDDRISVAITKLYSYLETSSLNDLRESVKVFEDIMATPAFKSTGPSARVLVLQSAARAYLELYEVAPDALLLRLGSALAQDAYDICKKVKRLMREPNEQEAIPKMLAIQIVWGTPIVANTLGVFLSESYLRTSDLTLLERAVEVCREAVHLSEGGMFGPERPLFHSAFGTALRYRFAETHDEADLAEAVVQHKAAVDLERENVKRPGKWTVKDGHSVQMPHPAERLAHFLNNLGNAYRERARTVAGSADCLEAVRCHREAMSLVAASDPAYARFAASLSDDLDCVRERDSRLFNTLYAELLAVAQALADGPSRHAFTLNRKLGLLAFEMGDFTRASASMARARRACRLMAATEPTLQGKTSWTHLAGGLAAAEAFSLDQLGDREAAVAVIEDGIATTMSEALRWRESALEEARRVDPSLAERMLAARAMLTNAESSGAIGSGSMSSRHALDIRVERERALEDLAGAERELGSRVAAAMSPGTVASLRTRLFQSDSCQAITYIVVTDRGTLALVVTDRAVESLPLKFNTEELETVLDQLDARGLRLTDYLAEPGLGLEAPLVLALDRLGLSLMMPIATKLAGLGVTSVLLIPVGRLSLLPLHAADWQHGPSRRSLIDTVTVSYAPTATVAAARKAGPRPAGALLRSVVAFGNPTPSARGDLPSAEAEVRAISALLEPHGVHALLRHEATLSEFWRRHSEASVFHFAGHGVFNRRYAAKSELLFANDEPLTVADCLGFRMTPPLGAVAILPGCDTAVVEGKIAGDECLGFTGALLVAGFTEVVGTLWKVDDMTAALLMVRLYRNLKMGLAVPEALRNAALWFRSATPGELTQFADEHGLGQYVRERSGIERSQNSWAAFIHSGVG